MDLMRDENWLGYVRSTQTTSEKQSRSIERVLHWRYYPVQP